MVVKIETRDCIMRLWSCRLFLNFNDFSSLIKNSNAVSFGVVYPISKNRCPLLFKRGSLKLLCKTLSEKNVIAEHESTGIRTDKRFPNQKSLSKTTGKRLFRIAQTNAPLLSILTQPLIKRKILRR